MAYADSAPLLLAFLFTALAIWIAAGRSIIIPKQCRKHRRGLGSGENTRWNRNIRTDVPAFPPNRRFSLEHDWVYEDTDPSREQSNEAIGKGLGRQAWTSASRKTPHHPPRAFDPSANPNATDDILRSQLLQTNGAIPNEMPKSQTSSASPEDALVRGWDYWSRLQCRDGHWAGDYGGPMFLLPGLVVACHIIGGDVLGPARRSAMVTYLRNHQQADGGYGLHIEGPSTMFGTTMNYVALRLLGLDATDPTCVAARQFIHKHGGATMNPHWGKFWLATLGVMEWDAVNPVPPELWLLPRWFPFHPGKMWCHCRMVYLPMSYVYGIRGTAEIHDIQMCLRDELYGVPYSSIDWDGARNTCASIDLYAPHTALMDAAFWVFRRYEWFAPRAVFNWMRGLGMDFALEYIEAEDTQTHYIDIGPVNKAVNMLATFYAHGADSRQLHEHLTRIDDYLYVSEDGMKMQGYNGSQLWDTAFTVQALADAPLHIIERFQATLTKAHKFIDSTQITDDEKQRERFFRTVSKGGWPFSTKDHGWPIADCTGEAMLAVLAVRSVKEKAAKSQSTAGLSTSPLLLQDTELLSIDRLSDSIELLSQFHNSDGGWATYEETRGGPWFEYLNPAEVFGDIMIDYTYTELTSSVVKALVAFRRRWPSHRPERVSQLIAEGVQFVRDQQRDDGSFYGSWAVCFTYGSWFGVEAIVAGGDPNGTDAAALKKCCDFLLSKQLNDGGWGESYLSCLTKEYTMPPDGKSLVVNTAWAVLTLVAAQCTDSAAVRRGVQFLVSSQLDDGNWPQQRISGMFNRTCGITYSSYRNVFPLWALAAYERRYALKQPTT